MDKNHMGIGMVGCGNICDIYVKNLNERFPGARVVACSARHMDRARETARRLNIPKAQTTEELLQNAEVDVVLNITTPASHYEINRMALEAGKHVYSEKPLAIELQDGEELLRLANKKQLRLGCAPDTFLGGGLQTCRRLLDQGAIGRPLAATAFLAWHGPEGEHPNPAFLYQYGAGPVFDYGPYYLTALVSLLGPAQTVCSLTGKGFDERTVTCPGPNRGVRFPVETPTHVTGCIAFQSGVMATLVTSFDVWGHGLPYLEIYGTEGTLRLPDPDTFGGPVYLLRQGEREFKPISLLCGNTENCRGIGLSDMVTALKNGVSHRASGKMALHVLEIMQALLRSGERREFIELHTACERPAPL